MDAAMEQQSSQDDPNSMTEGERDRLNNLMDPYSLNAMSTRILCSNTINRGTLKRADDSVDPDEEFYQRLRNKIGKTSAVGSKENFRHTNNWRNASGLKKGNAFSRKQDDIIKRFQNDIKRTKSRNVSSFPSNEKQSEFDLNIAKQPRSTTRFVGLRKESPKDPRPAEEKDNAEEDTDKQDYIFHRVIDEETVVEMEYEYCEVCYDGPSSDTNQSDSSSLFHGLPNYSLTSTSSSQCSDN